MLPLSHIRRYIFQFPKQWQNEKELLSFNGHKTKYSANTLNAMPQPCTCVSSISLIFLFLIKLHPSIIKLINHTQFVVMFTVTQHPKSLSQSIFPLTSTVVFSSLCMYWNDDLLDYTLFFQIHNDTFEKKGSIYLFNVFFMFKNFPFTWIWILIMGRLTCIEI